jgi:DNA-binding GntR family transcriptional regulator
MDAHDEIRSESIAGQVYAFLQREIVNGRLKPGARILEKNLSLRLGISRTPVREALLKLEMAGIVVCNSRRSYNVRILTVADVKEIFEVLGILEGVVVSSVAQAITQRDLDLLREYNQKMAEMAHGGDFHTYGDWNEKFHDVCISKYPNRSLRDLCDTVRRLLYTFPVRHDSLAQWIALAVEEHEEIIRLAVAKDGAALGAFVREVHWSHLRHSPYIEDAFAGEDPSSLCSDGVERIPVIESELHNIR